MSPYASLLTPPDILDGFFFYPRENEGLIELTLKERQTLFGNQGNYMASLVDMNDKNQVIDLRCAMDNNRIPTHRKPEAVIPKYGDVPLSLHNISNPETVEEALAAGWIETK